MAMLIKCMSLNSRLLLRLLVSRGANEERNSPIGILLNHLEQLQGLQHFTSHVLGSDTVMGRAHTIPLATSIDLGHGTNTSSSTEVQMADCGCCGSRGDVSVKMQHE